MKRRTVLAGIAGAAAAGLSLPAQSQQDPFGSKELIAAAIHRHSGRPLDRFVAVDCGSLTDTLLESELFGYVRGAFTGAVGEKKGLFEEANGGTIFLDEIGDIGAPMQAKLLRVLQEYEIKRVGAQEWIKVDVRVVAATNKDLRAEVEAGRFREDLYHRLAVITIHVPPLRERKDDIPLLASHFLGVHARRYRKAIAGFDGAAMQALIDNPWQGNVRELNHVVERSVLMAQDRFVKPSDLALRMGSQASAKLEEMSLEDVEAFLIKKALARYDGNVSQAANTLGLSRSALYRRLQRYGL